MKVEDINFPIEIKIIDDEHEYKVIFKRRPWSANCCESKNIKGIIRKRRVAEIVDGFELNKDMEEWGCKEHFILCPICGKDLYYHSKYDDIDIDIVRKAWLILVNKR